MEETQETQARITFDDVAKAVEEMGLTPQDTNASAIRQHLGRGGNSTIQKHLDTLRTTTIEQAPIEDRVDIPKETITHLWNSAVTAAKATMSVRTDRVLAEREAAQTIAAQAIRDRDSAFADAEQWEAKAKEAESAVRELEGHIAGMQSEHLEQLVNMQNSRAEIYNENAEIKHTLEVLRLEHQIETDRLVQQISDLKVMLYHTELPKQNSATIVPEPVQAPIAAKNPVGRPKQHKSSGIAGTSAE